ncbi:MAG: hypothetical protein EB149_08080, partial [Thaumarchaeota archaeon]|nr:hypothetical protein [Nitrososphaerota archaeon]
HQQKNPHNTSTVNGQKRSAEMFSAMIPSQEWVNTSEKAALLGRFTGSDYFLSKFEFRNIK